MTSSLPALGNPNNRRAMIEALRRPNIFADMSKIDIESCSFTAGEFLDAFEVMLHNTEVDSITTLGHVERLMMDMRATLARRLIPSARPKRVVRFLSFDEIMAEHMDPGDLWVLDAASMVTKSSRRRLANNNVLHFEIDTSTGVHCADVLLFPSECRWVSKSPFKLGELVQVVREAHSLGLDTPKVVELCP